MAASLVRPTARAALRAGASATPKSAGLAGLTFARGKATLPDLACRYPFPWVSCAVGNETAMSDGKLETDPAA